MIRIMIEFMARLHKAMFRSSASRVATAVGRVFFAQRLLFGLIIALLAALLIRPHVSWSHWTALKGLSALLVLFGLSLRALAGGFAGRHTRTSEMSAPRLVTGGTYAFVRNPIYAGSMAIGLGLVGFLGSWIALIPYGMVFALFYFFVIPAEEHFLRKTFGPQYDEYCRNVPRFFPRLTPWPNGEKSAFDWAPVLGEWRVVLAIALISSFFTIISL